MVILQLVHVKNFELHAIFVTKILIIALDESHMILVANSNDFK
jgi:hypothetical protein